LYQTWAFISSRTPLQISLEQAWSGFGWEIRAQKGAGPAFIGHTGKAFLRTGQFFWRTISVRFQGKAFVRDVGSPKT
jgi:hypothetical protein